VIVVSYFMIDCKKSFVFETSLFEWVGRSIGISSSTQLNSDLVVSNSLIKIKNIGVRFGYQTISQVSGGISNIAVDFSSIFSSISVALVGESTSLPNLKAASALISGTNVTFYYYNNTSSTDNTGIPYVIIGTLK